MCRVSDRCRLKGTADYVVRILSSKEFRADWAPSPVSDPYLLKNISVYVRTGSPEIAKVATWQGVAIAP
jgi:hypothetical protein